MHRKCAYFLFLAVLGMLVIGIVMLFSTSAFARDSHGDVYFFIKRQAIWLGVGLTVFLAVLNYRGIRWSARPAQIATAIRATTIVIGLLSAARTRRINGAPPL